MTDGNIFRHKRVAIDFDGTLFSDEGNVDVSFAKKLSLQAFTIYVEFQ